MKYVYPAVFRPDASGGYSIFFPDIHLGASQGESITDCIEMAEDFLCLSLFNMEEANTTIPSASDMKEIIAKPDDIVTLICVDTESYRRLHENRLVKKTLNIPSWLNERAEAANINFSQTLQKALREALQLSSDDIA